MRIDVKNEIWGSLSQKLLGKKILVIGTGSIAIFKTPEIVRELIRHGANVNVMLSPDAAKIVSPTVFEWASGEKVILDISGGIEHVVFAGEHDQKVDLIIVCPFTANTLGKFVHGIADSNVTLTLMTALGSNIPLLFVPGMHEPMYNNPIVRENLDKLKKLPNTTVINPKIEENKAKIPDMTVIVHWVIKLLTPQKLLNKNILITGGPTNEFIDKVRFISNPSTGKMGYNIALESWYQGASVLFIVGPNSLPKHELFPTISITSALEMAELIKKTLQQKNYDYAFFSAAVADFTPVAYTDDKIKSSVSELSINLKSTPKIIKLVKELKNANIGSKLKVIAFKAEYNKTIEELQEICQPYLSQNLADLMVSNLIGNEDSGFAVDSSEVHIFAKSGSPISIKGTKQNIAFKLVQLIIEKFESQ